MSAYRILIVDDSATTRGFIKRTLRLSGFEVEATYEAGDGVEALEALRTTRIDLVLTDLHMPRMDGLEMVRHMRADESKRKIPVVVVSSSPAVQRIEEMKGEGVQGYIAKPFTPESFRQALADVVGKN
jgi:two-component system chemotaxis response regulator CheY